MITIPIQVVGDVWLNKSQVIASLQSADKFAEIELNLNAEGASLTRLGIVDTIITYAKNIDLISITGWPNTVDVVPFKRKETHRASHFFWQHKLHQINSDYVNRTENIFGIFVGRRTIPRCKIFYDVYNNFPVCASLMNTRVELTWSTTTCDVVAIDNIDSWGIENVEQFINWWKLPPVKSLDNTGVWDQYSSTSYTNYSLLSWYDCFDIEIICETYCYGPAFFPTEKTVRPIAAGKPFLVFGPKDFLLNLRKLGFKTFSPLINETYDLYEGPARWKLMFNELKIVSKKIKEDKDFLNQLNIITSYNRTRLKEVVKLYSPT